MLFKAAFVILLYFAGTWLYDIVKFLGYHKHVYNHAPGPCRTVSGIPHGSEDFTLLPNGLAIISSGYRATASWEGREGAIYLMDMNHPEQEPVKFTINGGGDLNPLGTTVWHNKKTDQLLLYVVNLGHAEEQFVSSVEKYLVNTKKAALQHLSSIQHDLFTLLNGVEAVGEDQFYFTNSYAYNANNPFLLMLEQILSPRFSTVGFYDNGKSEIVADQLRIANGITTSLDKRFVYVVNMREQVVDVFSRREAHRHEKIQSYPLYSMGDNLKIDPVTGDLWIGSFPIGHQILAFLKDPSAKIASQILRAKINDGLITDLVEVYSNDGSDFAAASVALPYKGYMLAGSVGNSPIVCKLNSLH